MGASSSAPNHRLGEPWSRDELRQSVYEVVETLGDAFLLVDRDWRITFLSVYAGAHAATRVEMVGEPLGALFPELGEGALSRWGQYRQCMDARVPVRFMEYLSAEEIWTEVRAFPTADGGLSIFFRDVSEQMRAEATRLGLRGCADDTDLLAARRAAETDALKRAEFEQQLIGIVSHDLRNPLQAICLNAALGQRASDKDSPVARRFERIIMSANRAVRMIDDLLDYTRARNRGGIAVEPRPTNLHEVAAQVIEELLVTRPERLITRETVGDGAGLWDADRLAQVVQNLVGNALQHTTQDIPVRVTTRGEGDDVVLEVHNGGPAIPSADLARLFEPFQRGRSSRNPTGRSLGLGLYITSLIVHAHRGTVGVRSCSEEGTIFTVRLPRDSTQLQERGTDP